MNNKKTSWLDYQRNTRKHKTRPDGEYEVCVICGAVTDIPKSTPVERRTDYFPGAGQLCYACAMQNRLEEQEAMQNGYVYDIPLYGKNLRWGNG